MNDVFALITTYQDELLLRTAEHIFYTFAAVLCASMVGVSLGVCAFFYPRSKGAIIAFANIMQTIPSLAMLALLFVLIGQIGVWPVLISLVLYALLPIVRGTLSGLESISPALVEAARGLGLTPGQQLRMVRLPLASPHIISGIRVAMNFCVGIATIATFIGGGALGQFISRGLSKSETDLILLGAIPAALLALVLDALIAGLQRAFWHKGKPSGAPRWLKTLAVLLPLGVFVAGSAIMFAPRFETAARSDVITISSKNFTESRLLAEILAQTIEANTPYQVDRKPGLQGTLILHESLLKGEIDAYVEYTGTSYSAIMKRSLKADARAPEAIYQAVKDYYDEAELVALPPL
ncbi:MAG: glycine/betaine ABC transporter, partial [Rickettsiales bacterium]|nr:glycine/betaine ABC transporter [Rickettsiales bacterium]